MSAFLLFGGGEERHELPPRRAITIGREHVDIIWTRGKQPKYLSRKHISFEYVPPSRVVAVFYGAQPTKVVSAASGAAVAMVKNEPVTMHDGDSVELPDGELIVLEVNEPMSAPLRPAAAAAVTNASQMTTQSVSHAAPPMSGVLSEYVPTSAPAAAVDPAHDLAYDDPMLSAAVCSGSGEDEDEDDSQHQQQHPPATPPRDADDDDDDDDDEGAMVRLDEESDDVATSDDDNAANNHNDGDDSERRPKNASEATWALFEEKRGAELAVLFPDMTYEGVQLALADLWGSLPAQAREEWETAAASRRGRHKRAAPSSDTDDPAPPAAPAATKKARVDKKGSGAAEQKKGPAVDRPVTASATMRTMEELVIKGQAHLLKRDQLSDFLKEQGMKLTAKQTKEDLVKLVSDFFS